MAQVVPLTLVYTSVTIVVLLGRSSQLLKFEAHSGSLCTRVAEGFGLTQVLISHDATSSKTLQVLLLAS